jgi:tetratricopeptide (TPR) repeat protein
MPTKTAPKKQRPDPATQGMIDAAYHQQKVGNVTQAEILYQKVLVAEPGNPFALYALGTCAMQRGNMAAAVPLLRQALGGGYLHETVFTNLGIALQSLGRHDEALEVYRVAAEGDAKNPRYEANAAVVHAQKGDLAAAIAVATKVRKLAPKFTPNLVNLGFFLQESGRLAEAVEVFERIIALEPGHEAVQSALKSLHQKIAADR